METDPPVRKPYTLTLTIGTTISQPQLAAYLDLPQAWQAGLQLRSGLWQAGNVYEAIPEVGLRVRKLWLGDGDAESLRSPEYLDLGAGTYYGYSFAGLRTGPALFVAAAAGKYWAPFAELPAGMDVFVEISRYFQGYPPRSGQVVFFTAGISVFYWML